MEHTIIIQEWLNAVTKLVSYFNADKKLYFLPISIKKGAIKSPISPPFPWTATASKGSSIWIHVVHFTND